ncbi:MAG: AMP-binding protein [Pseudomonadota bacterium]
MSTDAVTIDVAGCNTISSLFWKRVLDLPNKVALREKDFGIWNEYTWSDYGEQASFAGLGLISLGLQRGDVCSIASEINKEWMFADLGIIGAGGICNGVYPTDVAEQVEYLITDSKTRFYFAEDEEQLDKVLEVRERTTCLEKIIIFDMDGLQTLRDPQCISFAELQAIGRDYAAQNPGDWVDQIGAAEPDDVMVLTYTSGTTGPPKGAMISQRNMLYMSQVIQDVYNITPDDEQLCFLPLAHIAGRMFYTFSPMESCSIVNIVESLETVNQDQQEVSPSVHFAVPRVWEKQFANIAIKLKDATALGRWSYEKALAVGTELAEYQQSDRNAPMWLRLKGLLAHYAVLKNCRKYLGIHDARWLSTAAAPIAPELIDWFWALGKPMYEVYGQTECTGLATANLAGDSRVGSIGKAVPGTEVRLSEEGELLIRGPGVIQGYWNNAQKTASTIVDGWLHTGDVGRIDDDGYIYILDRLKDIIITAGGKNITPSEIENRLKFSAYISDAVVVGDKRPYLSCLVMIDEENVTKFAQDANVPFTNYTSLCHTREVQDLIWEEIEAVNTKFARVETVKKFRLIDQLLDPEDEELTPTMKLKRKVVNVKYAELIDSMY